MQTVVSKSGFHMNKRWLPEVALSTILMFELVVLPVGVLAKGGHGGGHHAGAHRGGNHGASKSGGKHDGGSHRGAKAAAGRGAPRTVAERRARVRTIVNNRGFRRGWGRRRRYGPGAIYNNQQIIEAQKKTPPSSGATAFSRPYNAPPSYDMQNK